MFRYFSFVWDARDAEASARVSAHISALQSAGPHWEFAWRRPGIAVLHTHSSASPNRAYVLQEGAGVVLGKLFARRTASPSSAAPRIFDASESAKVVTSGGRHLIDHYWGRYVAFLHDAQTETTRILRDPTSGLPCLHASVQGVGLYFSWLEDAVRLGLPVTINWDYVAAHLCYQRLELNVTGLNEVTQLLAGECVEHRSHGRASAFYWDPMKLAAEEPIEDPAAAADSLRQSALDSVHAWAASYERIVHTLSGGLDSAIVLACLKEASARSQITCINYHSPGAAGDERPFARLAARRAGMELLEREREVAVDFEPLRHMPRGIAPAIYRYYLENSRSELELAREQGATALFSGEGGDQLFYQSRAIFAAGDHLHRRGPIRGLGSDFFRIALDAARVDGVSVWKVFRDAFARAWLSRQWTPTADLGRFMKLLSSEMIEAVKRDDRWIHPAFRGSRQAPSGKLWHAYALSAPAMEYYDPLGILEGVERVAPLFSQPVLEACLRIPVDVLTIGGWGRAIARRAFQHALPREIVTRRSKGDPGMYVKSVLAQHLDFVRGMLLEGELVRQKFLDRATLEATLRGDPTRGASSEIEIYDCLNVEAWLQRFSAVALATARQAACLDPGLQSSLHPHSSPVALQDPTAS
jgi:asparagine synthase (glutamine-hydrolysing)